MVAAIFFVAILDSKNHYAAFPMYNLFLNLFRHYKYYIIKNKNFAHPNLHVLLFLSISIYRSICCKMILRSFNGEGGGRTFDPFFYRSCLVLHLGRLDGRGPGCRDFRHSLNVESSRWPRTPLHLCLGIPKFYIILINNNNQSTENWFQCG